MNQDVRSFRDRGRRTRGCINDPPNKHTPIYTYSSVPARGTPGGVGQRWPTSDPFFPPPLSSSHMHFRYPRLLPLPRVIVPVVLVAGCTCGSRAHLIHIRVCRKGQSERRACSTHSGREKEICLLSGRLRKRERGGI